MTPSAEVLVARHHDAVLHLTLNRPAKRNALNAELRHGLVEHLAAAINDGGVRAVLLTGAGDHFCAGFDLDELMAAPDPAAVFAQATGYHQSVHRFPKPMVAAISGYAVAGGLDLALMCDLRLADPSARFGQPQIRHGVPASYELVAAVVGDSWARDLCLTGRVIDPTEANRIGLVHEVVTPGDVIDRALAVAAEIASRPTSVQAKQAFLRAQPQLFARPLTDTGHHTE